MINKAIAASLISFAVGILALTGPAPSIFAQPSYASTPAVQETETPSAVQKNPDQLYNRLAESRRNFEQGLQLAAQGRIDRGKEMTDSAMDQLVAGLRECTAVAGCDIEMFFDAISELLEKQRSAGAFIAPEEAGIDGGAAELEPQPSAQARPSPSRTLFRGKDLRELIELNDPIKAALNDWLTWLRPQLMDSYENYQYLRDKIAPIYEKAGLPEALLFGVVATETGGKVHAVSQAGATGLMQFMQSTGKKYGLTVKDGFDMRLDPVAATEANVAYLNDQLEILNQNLEKALAAYNGGENRLRRLNRNFKGVDFWDSRFYNSLPNETRSYVPRILAAAWLFLHPQDYNLQFKSFPKETGTLTVRQDTALDELSICLGQTQDQRNGWFRTLRNLNPQLEYNDTIKAGERIVIPLILKEAYEKNCLNGELIARARGLHEARFPEIIQYTVLKGDSLIKIANQFNCSIQEIAAINNLKGPRYLIRVGQKLKIPAYD